MPRTKGQICVPVKPGIIEWAINTSGWPIDELAEKLEVDQQTLSSWKKGSSLPKLKQLEDLASVIKRPLAVFFLSEPPREQPLPRDYRMLPDQEGRFKKETLLALRRARRLQRGARELKELQEESLMPDVIHKSTSSKPKVVAQSARKDFGVTDETHLKWHSSYDAFNTLRGLIESKNIFVFQIDMPIEDARGFVLVDEFPSVIVVNASDSIEARTFTLMHEFGHVILNESGINMPENLFINRRDIGVEKWCNEFASEFLFPESLASREFSQRQYSLLDGDFLQHLSAKYRVSKSMVLVKMLNTKYIDQDDYEIAIETLKRRAPPPKNEGGYGLSTEDRCIREKGRKYVSLVSKNIEKGSINYSDATDYLSVKLNKVDQIISKVE